MTNLIIYVTPTVIEVTILYVLLILFLNTRFIQRSRAIAVLITLIAIDSYLTIFISESIPYIRALLIPIAVSLSSILLFKDKIIKIFYFVALGYYFVYFSDIFSGLILSNLLNKNILQVIDVTDFYGILFYILTKSICCF